MKEREEFGAYYHCGVPEGLRIVGGVIGVSRGAFAFLEAYGLSSG